jgi:Helix-turn-helix
MSINCQLRDSLLLASRESHSFHPCMVDTTSRRLPLNLFSILTLRYFCEAVTWPKLLQNVLELPKNYGKYLLPTVSSAYCLYSRQSEKERSNCLTATAQTQIGDGGASRDVRQDVVTKRCTYPNLKLLIYTTGMRQKRLAKLAGIDEAYLSRILNGVRVPGQQLRLQIADVLGCDAKWLFEETKVEAVRGAVWESKTTG